MDNILIEDEFLSMAYAGRVIIYKREVEGIVNNYETGMGSGSKKIQTPKRRKRSITFNQNPSSTPIPLPSHLRDLSTRIFLLGLR